MASPNQCSLDLCILLQGIANCETMVEKSRLALNLLPYYSPAVCYKIMSEFCPAGIISQKDIITFLDEWKVDYCDTSVKGLLMDFCPIRNIFDYEDFLLMTAPKSLSEKKEVELPLSEMSDDLRFKLESSLVLFFIKELKYQKEVEKLRLKVIGTHKRDILALFNIIDKQGAGVIDCNQVKRLMDLHGLEFEANDWDNLVFRAKKLRSSNPRAETIYFTEFHDLIYPITYFEILGQKEYSQWINYLDTGERVDEADKYVSLPEQYASNAGSTPNSGSKIMSSQEKEVAKGSERTPAKVRPPGDEATQIKLMRKSEAAANQVPTMFANYATNKKGKVGFPSPIDLSFFDSLYKVGEDEKEKDPSKIGLYSSRRTLDQVKSPQSKDEVLTSSKKRESERSVKIVSGNSSKRNLKSNRDGDDSFFEMGMSSPWLRFDKKYENAGMKGKNLTSKFVRYLVNFKDATANMYG